MKYPAMAPRRKSGQERIIDPAGRPCGCLMEFWQWAYSDLVGNTERGALAEYFVAMALGIQQEDRISWDKYDLLSPEGISVEVKTSGYIQTWGQDRLSALSFGIQPTHSWDSKTNEFEKEVKRQADVYVFCVHKHTDQRTLDPLDIGQWEFYPLATKVLNEQCGGQKRITMSGLLQIGARPCAFHDLRARIMEEAKRSDRL